MQITNTTIHKPHVKKNHTLIEHPTWDLFFGNVLLVVGAGHMGKIIVGSSTAL